MNFDKEAKSDKKNVWGRVGGGEGGVEGLGGGGHCNQNSMPNCVK